MHFVVLYIRHVTILNDYDSKHIFIYKPLFSFMPQVNQKNLNTLMLGYLEELKLVLKVLFLLSFSKYMHEHFC